MGSLCRMMMLTVVFTFLVMTPIYISGEPDTNSTESGNAWKDFWVVRLLLNLFGYATIVIPGYLIISYVKRTGYLDRAGKLVFCFISSILVHFSV